MTKAPVTGQFFKRVRGGMAKIEDAPRPVIGAANLFPLVTRDDCSFETTVRGNSGTDFSL